VLKHGFKTPKYPEHSYRAFESFIDFEIRFMTDTGCTGCNWLELSPNKYSLRDDLEKSSTVQLEVDVHWNEFTSHPPDGDWQKIAPMRILSFDIECAGRKGIFPTPEVDPVIQIAIMVKEQGGSEPFIKTIFCLNTCSTIVDSDVFSFRNETDLLQIHNDEGRFLSWRGGFCSSIGIRIRKGSYNCRET